MNESYVFLDSTRNTPQIIQHQVIKAFAINNDLNISFYGAEFIGLESRHNQLLSYIEASLSKHYIFYSVEQFFNESIGYDFSFIKPAVLNEIKFYFAVENRKILSLSDMQILIKECQISFINRTNRFRDDLVNYNKKA